MSGDLERSSEWGLRSALGTSGIRDSGELPLDVLGQMNLAEATTGGQDSRPSGLLEQRPSRGALATARLTRQGGRLGCEGSRGGTLPAGRDRETHPHQRDRHPISRNGPAAESRLEAVGRPPTEDHARTVPDLESLRVLGRGGALASCALDSFWPMSVTARGATTALSLDLARPATAIAARRATTTVHVLAKRLHRDPRDPTALRRIRPQRPQPPGPGART